MYRSDVSVFAELEGIKNYRVPSSLVPKREYKISHMPPGREYKEKYEKNGKVVRCCGCLFGENYSERPTFLLKLLFKEVMYVCSVHKRNKGLNLGALGLQRAHKHINC